MKIPFTSLSLVRAERRHSVEDPRTPLASAIENLMEFYGSGPTTSGQRVNATTALQLTAVFACVRVLAESVASVPLVIYRRKGSGKERAPEHPAYNVLHDRANTEQSSFMWRETIMGHLALRGNTYSEKEYDGAGRLVGLWPITPDRVSVERKNGVKQFQIDGGQKTLTAEQILHIPGLGYDGLVGYSPITVAREAISLGLAAQEHGARFFSNGATTSGALEHPGRIGPDAIKNLRASFTERHVGSSNAHKPIILEEGMKWHQLSVSNVDSQFLETRKFQISEIARVFRIPPHLIGDLDRATFSNIEQQSIDFVVHTLRPWLVRIEQALNWELFDEGERKEYFCEFNVDGLLRGDSAARSSFYTSLFNIGVLSVNDIREKENMNPVDDGDKRFVPMNMTSLDKAGEESVAPKPKLVPDDEDEDDRSIAAFAPMVRDVLERALFREATAAKRAAKRGADGFRSWISDYQSEQAEYLTRSLMPVVQGISAGRAPNDVDLSIVRGMVMAEIAKTVTAYRALANDPTEKAVTDALDAVSNGLDAAAREITARMIGLLQTTPQERKAA